MTNWDDDAHAAAVLAADSELTEVALQASRANWDGDGAAEISIGTTKMGRVLLRMLPPGVPMPEISAEPAGWLAFEWRSVDDARWLSVSVQEGQDWACNWVSAGGDFHGAQEFDSGNPFPPILGAIIDSLNVAATAGR